MALFPICLAYESIQVRRPPSTSNPIPFSGLHLIMDPCQWCHMFMVDTRTSLCHCLSLFLVITCIMGFRTSFKHRYDPSNFSPFHWPLIHLGMGQLSLPRLRCMTHIMIPLLFRCSSIFLPLYSQSVSNSLLFSAWMSCILNQVGGSLAAQIWASACSSLCFKLVPSNQSHTSVTFPSFLALILPPSPSYPSFSITFSWSSLVSLLHLNFAGKVRIPELLMY